MSKGNRRKLAVVGAILIALTGLYIYFGLLAHERENELARLSGDDELTQVLFREADEFRLLNRRQQEGILIAGIAVIVVSGAWLLLTERRHSRDVHRNSYEGTPNR